MKRLAAWFLGSAASAFGSMVNPRFADRLASHRSSPAAQLMPLAVDDSHEHHRLAARGRRQPAVSEADTMTNLHQVSDFCDGSNCFVYQVSSLRCQADGLCYVGYLTVCFSNEINGIIKTLEGLLIACILIRQICYNGRLS